MEHQDGKDLLCYIDHLKFEKHNQILLSNLFLWVSAIQLFVPINILFVQIRAQPDVTSGSSCPGNFKCPDSGLPFFFLTRLRTYQGFRNGEKPLILFSAILKFTFCQLMTSQQQSMVSYHLMPSVPMGLMLKRQLSLNLKVGGRGKV